MQSFFRAAGGGGGEAAAAGAALVWLGVVEGVQEVGAEGLQVGGEAGGTGRWLQGGLGWGSGVGGEQALEGLEESCC